MAFPISQSFTGVTSGQSIAVYDANWTINRNQLEMETTTPNTVQPDDAADADAYRNDISNTADTYAEGTWRIFGGASNYAWVTVRLTTDAAPDGYVVYVQSTAIQMARMDNGSFTNLGSASTIATGQLMRVEAEGTTIRGKSNGTQFASVTDSTYSTGRVGLGGYGYRSTVDSGISSFAADALGAAAASFPFRPGRSFGGLIVR
jgi:hypothetical protein